MPRFSANLGFLWAEYPLEEAIHASKAAGFSAVELHWPYEVPASRVRDTLRDARLPVMGLNTHRGNVAKGENGLSALPGRSGEARQAIDMAVEYGALIGAGAIHVMAGNSGGPHAREAFLKSLDYACTQAAIHEMTILIEPLNPNDASDYFLKTTDQAIEVIRDVRASNLKLMFDCYHVGRTEGDVSARLERHLPDIGHIQFASVPNRSRPDEGELNYSVIFQKIDALRWCKPIGAEYKPGANTEATLGWMNSLV